MRRPDWEERLAILAHEAQTRAFKWGEFDCCTFAADAVQAITGRDPMWMLRGRYSTARGALRILKDLGGLEKAVRIALGVAPLERVATAQRGDIVLVKTKLPALGVVVGASALVPLTHGVQRVPVGDWVAAWRVE